MSVDTSFTGWTAGHIARTFPNAARQTVFGNNAANFSRFTPPVAQPGAGGPGLSIDRSFLSLLNKDNVQNQAQQNQRPNTPYTVSDLPAHLLDRIRGGGHNKPLPGTNVVPTPVKVAQPGLDTNISTQIPGAPSDGIPKINSMSGWLSAGRNLN